MKKIAYAVVLILLLGVFLIPRTDPRLSESFDSASFNERVQILASDEMEGRYTGSSGNEKAMAYVEEEMMDLGIEPLFDDGYRQTFETPVMIRENQPFLSIADENGAERLRLEIDRDFVIDPWWTMNDIDYSGDMIVLMGTIYTIDQEYLKDKVVFTATTRLLPDTLEGLIEAGAKGVIYYSSEPQGNAWDDPLEYGNRYPQVEHKRGTPFFVARVPMEIFQEVGAIATENPIPEHCVKRNGVDGYLDFSGWVHNVTLKADYSYPVVKSANLFGLLPAKKETDEILVLAASLDGIGMEGDILYPGAYNNASGVSFLLETAEAMSQSEARLDKNIVFAFFNGRYQGNMGARYAADHLPFDPQHSQILSIEGIGSSLGGVGAILHNSHAPGDAAGILYTQLLQYADHRGLEMGAGNQSPMQSSYPFESSGMPVVAYLSDRTAGLVFSPSDATDIVIGELAARDAKVLYDYIEDEAYGYSSFQWLPEVPMHFWWALAVWGSVLALVRMIPRWRPRWAVLERLSAGMESLTASAAIMALLMAGLLYVLLLPGDFMIGVRNGSWISNYSTALTSKRTYEFIGEFFGSGGLKTLFITEVWPLVLASLKLLLPALLIAIILGTAKGLLDGLSSRPVHRLVSVSLYSIPDGFVAMMGLIALVFLSNRGYLPEGLAVEDARLFVIPIILLSLVPSIYVSAAVSEIASDTKRQPYLKALKARGISDTRIVLRHVLPISFVRLMETMPAILSVSLANLFIIEYLYAYPGLGSYVVKNLWLPEKVICFSLGIGLVYLMLAALFRSIAGMLAFRRKGAHHEA